MQMDPNASGKIRHKLVCRLIHSLMPGFDQFHGTMTLFRSRNPAVCAWVAIFDITQLRAPQNQSTRKNLDDFLMGLDAFFKTGCASAYRCLHKEARRGPMQQGTSSRAFQDVPSSARKRHTSTVHAMETSSLEGVSLY